MRGKSTLTFIALAGELGELFGDFAQRANLERVIFSCGKTLSKMRELQPSELRGEEPQAEEREGRTTPDHSG